MNHDRSGKKDRESHGGIWDDYWSKIERYDERSFRAENPYYRLLRELIDLPGKKRGRILEVGCGSGMMTIALRNDLPWEKCEAYLVDLSAPALRLARENSRANQAEVFLVRTDARSLPFPDGSFDIVYNEGLNEHFDGERRQDIFNEMARVCRPGGQVAVIVPNIGNLPYRLQKRLLERRRQWEFGFEKAFSCRELHQRMTGAGLAIVRRGGTKVARPLVDLLKSITIKDRRGLSAAGGSGAKSFLRGVLRSADGFLGRHFWFLTRDIGMSGMKNGPG